MAETITEWMSNATEVVVGEKTQVSDEMFAIIVLGMTLLSILTISGNFLVMAAYFTNPSLQTTTNYFILSLAISDLCVAFISINFMTVHLLHHKWQFGYIACDILLSIDYSVCQASGFNIVAIAFDRMLKVIYPMHKLRKPDVKKCIIFLWVASFLIWFGSIFGYHHVYPDHVESEACHIPYLYKNKNLTVTTSVIHFYLPAFLIVAIYMIVSLKLLKQHKALKKYQGSNFTLNVPKVLNKNLLLVVERPSSTSAFDVTETLTYEKQRATVDPDTPSTSLERVKKCRSVAFRKIMIHRRAIILLTIVSVAYIVTYLPYSVFTIITAYNPHLITSSVWDFGYVFCYVNSLLNPLCYAVGNRKYRYSFINIFKKLKLMLFSTSANTPHENKVLYIKSPTQDL